jgi:hypothetical protein
VSRRRVRGQRWNVKDGSRELRRAYERERRAGGAPPPPEAEIREAHVRSQTGWCLLHDRQEAVPGSDVSDVFRAS